ncbi:protein roadkill-like [Belonocnema kinseyi]|uniref:protein roadkill-like n=1 Tax=Belonocnema kinseyi TaxID=2817044 RepID=UPI00143E0E79|nr:protein roadkill-like [Belonocnema kinseyi]
MAEGEKKVTSFTWDAGNLIQLFEGKKSSLKSPEFLTEISLATKTLDEKCFLKWTLLAKKVIEMERAESDKHSSKKRRTTGSLAKVTKETMKGQYLGLYLQNNNDELPYLPILKVTFSIVKPTSGKIYSKGKELLMIVEGVDFGISDFIMIAELEKLSLCDLMILCEFEEAKKDIESFKPLLNNTMFSDIELIVGKNVFPAHKLVLALSSSYFREKIANDDSLTSLKILDTKSKYFEQLLRFMYTGKLDYMKSEELIDFKLIEAVCQYKVWDFFADYEIEETLKAGLNIKNIIPTLLLIYEARLMEETRSFFADCIYFTMVNLTSMVDLDFFKNLVTINPQLLETILIWLHWKLVVSKCKRKIDVSPLKESNIEKCISCKQFEALLNNQKYSDIDIQIGDKTYHAHKLILGTRSPVFDRMFSHNMAETISGVVKIEDTEPEIFYQVLRFIYTNEFETKKNDLILKIWIVADKYDIDDLKFECENILGSSLTHKTFKRTVTFADNRNMERLKRMCVLYFIDNMFIKEYDQRAAFNQLLYDLNFTASNPHLLLEILNALVLDCKLVLKNPKKKRIFCVQNVENSFL